MYYIYTIDTSNIFWKIWISGLNPAPTIGAYEKTFVNGEVISHQCFLIIFATSSWFQKLTTSGFTGLKVDSNSLDASYTLPPMRGFAERSRGSLLGAGCSGFLLPCSVSSQTLCHPNGVQMAEVWCIRCICTVMSSEQQRQLNQETSKLLCSPCIRHCLRLC